MKLPYKTTRNFETALALITLAPAAASVFFYRHFPERVPTHWGIDGEPNGWSGPGFAAFFFPAMIIGLYLLLMLLPAADPQKDRYKEFGRAYQVIRLVMSAFMTVIYFVASLKGIGYDIPINQVMMPSLGLMFIALGNFMPKFRKNWFVGIRTPWTLSDERVWNRTHRFGGKAFMVTGVACLLATFVSPELAFGLVIGSAVGVSLLSFVYSWWLWKNLPKKDDGSCCPAEKEDVQG